VRSRKRKAPQCKERKFVPVHTTKIYMEAQFAFRACPGKI